MMMPRGSFQTHTRAHPLSLSRHKFAYICEDEHVHMSMYVYMYVRVGMAVSLWDLETRALTKPRWDPPEEREFVPD